MIKNNNFISGDWYAVTEYLKTKKSVVYTTHLEMCSSAGNWSGIYIKKIGSIFKVYAFSQENKRHGFSFYNGGLLFETRKPLTYTRIEAIERLACKMLFN